MTCPLLVKSQPPKCGAVAGGPLPIERETVGAFCRDAFTLCPAYRYVRATGRSAHPADFRSWVVLRVPPGKTDPVAESFPPTDPG
jgi:hypothetical protein